MVKPNNMSFLSLDPPIIALISLPKIKLNISYTTYTTIQPARIVREMMILIKMKFVTIVTILTTTRRGVRRKEEAPPTPTGSESPRFSTASLFGFDSEFRHMDNLL